MSQNHLASFPHHNTMANSALEDGAGTPMLRPEVTTGTGRGPDDEVVESKVDTPSGIGSNAQIPPPSSDLDANTDRLPYTRKSTLTGWPLELLCCCLSSVCFYSILEIFLVYDNKSSPEFPLGITLNSMVALLSSICSMSCTFIVAEGVSQMKWNHFARGKPQPLSYLQAFDDASRGVWGSFKLLFVVDSVGSFVLLLVVFFVMIAGLLSPSITQSAIATVDMPRRDGSVVAGSGPLFSIQETSQLRTAVQLGLATPYYTNITPVAPLCTTGNCEFPIFTTLAVCSDVRNVTEFLTFSDFNVTDQQALEFLGPIPVTDYSINETLTTTYPQTDVRNASLPTGAFLIGGPEYFGLNISYAPESERLGVSSIPWNHTQSMYPTLRFNGDQDLLRAGIVKLFVIWLNQAYFRHPSRSPRPTEYLDGAFRASEVLLHFCLKRVKVVVKEGIQSTNLSDTSTSYKSNGGESQTPGIRYRLKMERLGTDSSQSFYVDEDSFLSLFYYLRRRLRGTLSFITNPYLTVRDQTSSSEIIGDALWSEQVTWGSNETDQNVLSIHDEDREQDSRLRNVIRNLADSLTNMVRQTDGERTTPLIRGTALQHGIILIRWQYLILPGLQVAMSITFLVCIIRQTINLKVELYKSQLLPVLLAINPADRSRLLQFSENPTSPETSDGLNDTTDDAQHIEA